MAAAEENVQDWNVKSILQDQAVDEKYACILLNQAILETHKAFIRHIWDRATLRLCADGGANRLYDTFGEQIALPHEVRGDLDSVRSDVLKRYAEKNVKVTKVTSQYATDLQKCLLAVEEFEQSSHRQGAEGAKDDSQTQMTVIIIGGLSGRLDQTMHTFHVLCQVAPTNTTERPAKVQDSQAQSAESLEEEEYARLRKRTKTITISDNSIAWLLTKGSHKIMIDQFVFGPTCGLLPFAAVLSPNDNGGTRIWTKGLRWNLDGEVSAIGSFLSTSNHLKDDEVIVRTEGPIIWTMEIREGIP